ncbi:MAG TPA: MFS transporter [Gaiellales bacterium]|nr:MFS transporter [Gaiellales bacterium]
MQRAPRNLAFATIAFTICFTSWGLVTPLAKHLQDPEGWSDTQVLVLAAVPVLCGSLLRLPAGWLADRYGGRLIFTLIMVASVIPAVLLGYVTGYTTLLVVGFYMGAAGSAFAAGVPFVAGWYDRSRQGFAVGVYGIGTIGPAIALLVVPRTLDRYGQAYLGWGMAAVLVTGAAITWLLAHDAPNRAKPTRYGDVAGGGWRLYRLALLYFVTFGGFVAMFTFLQKLLTTWFALSDVDAGARAAGFAALAVAARPVGGWMSDRYGAAIVLTAAFAGVAVDGAVLAAIATHPTIVTVSIACLTMGVFLGVGSGAIFKLVPNEFPENPGAATGIVGAIGGLGGFFPPVVMGLVKGWTGSFALGFIGLLAFCIICFGIALSLLMHTRAVRTGSRVAA